MINRFETVRSRIRICGQRLRCLRSLPDTKQADDDRAQDNVEDQLEDKVSSDQAEDHVLSGILKAQRGSPLQDRREEEHTAADEEDPRVYDRADDGCQDHSRIIGAGRLYLCRAAVCGSGGNALSSGQSPIDQASTETREDAFQQHRHDRSDRVNDQKRAGVTREQDHEAEDEAKPGSGARSVEGRTDHDGDQHQGNRERAKPYKGSQEL